MTSGTAEAEHRLLLSILMGVGLCVGIAVALFAHDVIIGVAAGAILIMVTNQLVKLWSGHGRGHYGRR